MFGFLNSALLIAAAAALIPLLIHLFSKRKVKIVEFSSLKFLKQMQKRQVRRLKIRQLLLLILRMLIILMIVLAFARPTSTGGNLGSHASVSAVIIFDNSSSINRYVADGNLFEIAKKRTEKLLDSFGESDEVILLPFILSSSSNSSTEFMSVAQAKEKLNNISINQIHSDFTASLTIANALLTSANNLNKELYIVSDLQLNSLPERRLLEQSEARLFLIELPLEPVENVAISSLDFGGQLILPGHDFKITAGIKNYSGSFSAEIIASLFINGNRVSQTDITIEPGEESSVTFTKSVSATGFHSGYIEISDDKFLEDNKRYFSFSIPDNFNVLLVGNDLSSQLFRLALSPSTSLNQYWSLKNISPANLSGINFFEYDIVFLFDPSQISETYRMRLFNYVESGNSLYINYNENVDITEFNKKWSALSGVLFDKPVDKQFSRAGYYTFSTVELTHPIFSVFEFKDNKPPEIKFYSLPKMHTLQGATTVAVFTGSRPALIENEYGQGKVLTFTAPISPEYSNLTAHSFFVPFVSRMAEYLARDISSFDTRLFSSNNISRSLALKGSVLGSIEMISPDSSSSFILPVEKNGALIVNASPAHQNGIYRLSYLGREIDRFAVNLDPSESNLISAAPDQFSQAAGAEQFHLLSNTDNLAASISELRFGKEFWQLFLWIAVLLIAAEIMLARTKNQKE